MQLARHAAAVSQGVLQPLGEGNKALAALYHLPKSPAAPGEAVVKQQMGKRFSTQGDLYPFDLG